MLGELRSRNLVNFDISLDYKRLGKKRTFEMTQKANS